MMMSGSDASTCGARLFEPQPIERGHRNHRPGGTSQAQGSPAISGKDRDQAGSLPHRNEVPSIQMRCRMTASLRATATCAFFMPLRLASRSPQAFSAHQRRVGRSKTLAASKRYVRSKRSPHRET